MLAGTVEHGDSLGNKGKMGAGDVQWMTAGSGIMHQEMPQGDARGRMHGFQLWANLPSSLKMTAPRYQDIPAAVIPEVIDDDGTHVRVITGDFWGKKGPVEGVAADPRYLDVFVPPGKRKTLPVEVGRHAFAYVFEGSGTFAGASQPFGVLTEKETPAGETLVREQTGNRSLVVFDSRRRGDGAGRRRGHPLPAGVRQADRGAGRLVRADRDEHPGGAAAGGRASCATARSSSTGDRSSRVPHAVQHEVMHRRCGTPVPSFVHQQPGSRVCTAALRAAVRPGHEFRDQHQSHISPASRQLPCC